MPSSLPQDRMPYISEFSTKENSPAHPIPMYQSLCNARSFKIRRLLPLEAYSNRSDSAPLPEQAKSKYKSRNTILAYLAQYVRPTGTKSLPTAFSSKFNVNSVATHAFVRKFIMWKSEQLYYVASFHRPADSSSGCHLPHRRRCPRWRARRAAWRISRRKPGCWAMRPCLNS